MDPGGSRDPGALAEWVRGEASRCMYCGLCEPSCPTLPLGPHRGYGPRGRVYLALAAVEEGRLTVEGLASIYSCLLCAACTLACPAGVDVPGVVRAVRSLARTGLAAPGRADA
ncbi:4Fe-4S dicluster domain-containing protein [Stetteria hydrogenophila]